MSFINTLAGNFWDDPWGNPWYSSIALYYPAATPYAPPSYFTKMVSELHPSSSPCFKKKRKKCCAKKAQLIAEYFTEASADSSSSFKEPLQHLNTEGSPTVVPVTISSSPSSSPETPPPSVLFLFTDPTSTKSSPEIPPPPISSSFTDLYFIADISEDYTTKSEWKPSPDPFTFGDFESKSKETSEDLVMASPNSGSGGRTFLQNSNFEMKLMEIDDENLGIPEAENGVSENAVAVSFVTVRFGAEEVHRTLNRKCKVEQELPLILSIELKIDGSFVLVANLVDDSDVYIGNNLTNSFGCYKKILDAQKVFDRMPERFFVSWNSIHCLREPSFLALMLFDKMAKCILPTCAPVSASLLRKEANDFSVGTGLVDDVSAGNTVSQIYEANEIFERMKLKDVVSWNAMVTWYSQTSRLELTVPLFDKMRKKNINLDEDDDLMVQSVWQVDSFETAGFSEENGTIGDIRETISGSDLVLMLISDYARLQHDKKQKEEEHYNSISALHKSMRGSDVNAGIYGLAIFSCMPTTLSSGVALTQLDGENSTFMEALNALFQNFNRDYNSEDVYGFFVSLLFGHGPLLGGIILVTFALAFHLHHAFLTGTTCGIAFVLGVWPPVQLILSAKLGPVPVVFLFWFQVDIG